MKVSAIMEQQVDFVTIDTTVKEVCHLIFERGINGVPVCEGKKVIGFITERDVLSKFFPTMQEYIEDPIHEGNFEGMEQKVTDIFSLAAEKIMSNNPIVIDQDAPILQAQSLMFVHKIGRLPVVDEKGNLVGIVAKGDIFRTIVGQKLSLGDEESYFDWQANYYDYFMDWKVRLNNEMPGLVKAFKKAKVKKIIDIACSTGEHSIALAKNGFEVVGLDSSGKMIRISDLKKAKLSDDIRDKVQFLKGYKESIPKFPKDFDAAIFMGNALSHVIVTDSDILKETVNVLRSGKGVLVFQISNYDKVLRKNDGLREFVIKRFGLGFGQDHAFLTFYKKGKGKTIIHTRAIFDYVGDKWVLRGMNDTQVMYFGRKEIEKMLKKLDFKEIDFYGSRFNSHLFKNSFNLLESDWLNVIAKR